MGLAVPCGFTGLAAFLNETVDWLDSTRPELLVADLRIAG